METKDIPTLLALMWVCLAVTIGIIIHSVVTNEFHKIPIVSGIVTTLSSYISVCRLKKGSAKDAED